MVSTVWYEGDSFGYERVVAITVQSLPLEFDDDKLIKVIKKYIIKIRKYTTLRHWSSDMTFGVYFPLLRVRCKLLKKPRFFQH